MRIKRIFALVFSIIFILALPFLLIMVLSSEDVSGFLKGSLKISNAEAIDYILNYISLALSLVLGEVVYFQSQRINDLEASEYDVFLGVEDINYSFDFGEYVFADIHKNKSEFFVTHIFKPNKKAIITSVNIGDEAPGNPELIPLVFITKNHPLIVSLYFRAVEVELLNEGKRVFIQEYKNRNKAIHTILGDESRFVLGFGMTTSHISIFDEVVLRFSVEVIDQNKRKQQISSTVVLNKGVDKLGYYLTSSYSSKE